MRPLSSIVLVGLVAACATGETPVLGESMDPSELDGSAGTGTDTAGTFSGSGSGNGGPSAGSFTTGGETTGGTFSTGGFNTAGTGFGFSGTGTAGTPVGGSGSGGGGSGPGGAGGKAGAGGSGGKATGGNGGMAGMPQNGTCAQNPIGPKADWTATASVHGDNCANPNDAYCGPPERGIDGVPNNRYTTGVARTGNEWYQIDFGETVTVSRVVLNTAAGSTDYTLSYEVRMSDSEGAIAGSASIISGNGMQGTTTINFPSPKTGRYLRVSQKMAMMGWWSLAEVEISCQ